MLLVTYMFRASKAHSYIIHVHCSVSYLLKVKSFLTEELNWLCNPALIELRPADH